jgi:6-phosphogluconate dehydrogenase
MVSVLKYKSSMVNGHKARIGVIGMAVMGQNLARNFASRKIPTVVFNRTTKVTNEVIKEFGNEYLVGSAPLKDFVSQLERPRSIIILIKAGKAVDSVVSQLIPLLSKGDIIIDGGNSNYKDTIRRTSELESKGLHFVGCGVSGGEEGALHGPSLMPGGSKKSWSTLKKILEPIAALDFKGGPCVTHLGTDGAGHYVKMVHNGIEYAIVQLMAEAYDLLRKQYKLSATQIADIFEGYGNRKLRSYLFEIALPVLRAKDDLSKDYLINRVLDKAGQKGTGKWTAIDALDKGVSFSLLSEAVFARVTSSQKEERVQLEKKYGKQGHKKSQSKVKFIKDLEKALYSSIILSYTQGFMLLSEAAKVHKWKLNFAEIARIWQGGCIIRAKLLVQIQEGFKKSKKSNLLMVSDIAKVLKRNDTSLRNVVAAGIIGRVPVPVFSAALSYFDSITSSRSGANFIQGMRDYWGAHTYERTDKKGSFHSEWKEE